MAISEKEFGILQSDVKHLLKTSDEHTKVLAGIDAKLDGLVTKEQFEKRTRSTDARFERVESRVRVLEDSNKARDLSFFGQIGNKFNSWMVSAFGVGLAVILLYATSKVTAEIKVIETQMSQNRQVIKDNKQMIDEIKQKEKEEEKNGNS